MKWVKYVLTLLWFIGLMFVLSRAIRMQVVFMAKWNQTLMVTPWIFYTTLIGLAVGLYIGLVFIRRDGIKLNRSMLICGFIPCFIVSAFVPIVFGIEILQHQHHLYAPFELRLIGMRSYDFIQIATGVTFMAGLFTGRDEHKNARALINL